MRTYTVAPALPTPFKAVASVFIGSLGTVWLFIEPLGLFGLVPPMSGKLGWITYLIILIASLLISAAFVRGYRWYKVHYLPFVRLTIASASDGATYSVRASANMQIGDFLRDFLKILLNGLGSERVKAFRQRYLPIFQVYRNDKFIDVDSNLTIAGAGLNDDLCQIRGEKDPSFDRVLFSIAPHNKG